MKVNDLSRSKRHNLISFVWSGMVSVGLVLAFVVYNSILAALIISIMSIVCFLVIQAHLWAERGDR